jgi:PD-(D/E)XK endonuclease
MLVHHTKTKGDLGVLAAELDLFEKGLLILRPQTEHAPFDLVVYRDERFYRVQVKYRAAVDGLISFHLATCWADKHGVHVVPIDKSAIDILCIYSPDARRCYYLDPRGPKKTVNLRLSPPRNQQKKNITWAHECTEIPATVVGVPAASSQTLEQTANVRQSSLPFERP